MEQFTLTPIGRFHSLRKYPYDSPKQSQFHQTDGGTIELFPKHQFEQALEDVKLFSHLWIVFLFHHNEHWKPKVLPPRHPQGSKHKVGVFASRSPYRPNPIGISCVELLQIKGLELSIGGSDLLDGTPILDIKPYLVTADCFPDASLGWLQGVEQEKFELSWEPLVLDQLAWLAQNGLEPMKDFLQEQLSYFPFDQQRKRVRFEDPHWVIAYRTWRIHFVHKNEKALTICMITSGYNKSDLENPIDPWTDKSLHQDFNNFFTTHKK